MAIGNMSFKCADHRSIFTKKQVWYYFPQLMELFLEADEGDSSICFAIVEARQSIWRRSRSYVVGNTPEAYERGRI